MSSSNVFFGFSLNLDLFYTGENLAHRSIVSLTCPHCNRSGYLPRTLLVHCIEDHSQLTNHQDPNSTKQLVVCKRKMFRYDFHYQMTLKMCPICVLLPSQDYTNRFVSLTDHLARDHEGETSIPWSNANLQRRNLENKRVKKLSKQSIFFCFFFVLRLGISR